MRRGGGYNDGGFGGGGGYDYGGGASALGGTYSGAYGHTGAPPQEAFPAYSPSSKYRKGKVNTVTAVLGALLVLMSVTSVYLFVRTNTLSKKAEKLSVELSASQAQQTKEDRDRMIMKRDLDVAREKLDDKTRRVDEANKHLQEANTQLRGLKDEVRQCKVDLTTAHRHEADIQLKLDNANEQLSSKETSVDTDSLQKELSTAQIAARAADSRLRQNEKEWEQEKKILKLDLELAKATIERYEMAKEAPADDTEPEAAEAKETQGEAKLSGAVPPVEAVPEAAVNEEAAAAKPEAAEQVQHEEPKVDVEEPPHDDNQVPPLPEPLKDDDVVAPKEGEEVAAAAASHPDPEAAVAQEQGVQEGEAKGEEEVDVVTQRELRRRARRAERDGDEGEGGQAKE